MKRLAQYDTFNIPVSEIYYDERFNCRGVFTLQSVAELSESIKEVGLQFPVIVQPWLNNGCKYRLIAGHRRFKACSTFLKWNKIPATVRTDLDRHQAQILNLIENLERKDLNMLEEAKALKALYPKGVALRVAAAELKRPTRWVHTRQRLIKFPEEIQQMAASGRLKTIDIEAIWNTPESERVKAAREIVKLKSGGRQYSKFPDELRRKFRPRKTKDEIGKMVGVLLNSNINGLPPRLLAWAAGFIKDKEIARDIEVYAVDWQDKDDED